jgi:hypothetical protein
MYGNVVYSGGSPRIALKALLASAFLQYTMTAIAMPWEVSKVLLQVQWVPKQLEGELAVEYELELELELEEEEDNDELVSNLGVLISDEMLIVIHRAIHLQTIRIFMTLLHPLASRGKHAQSL